MAFTRYANFVTSVSQEGAVAHRALSRYRHKQQSYRHEKTLQMHVKQKQDQIRSDQHGCRNESDERNQAACNHPSTVVGSVGGSLREASATTAAAATAGSA